MGDIIFLKNYNSDIFDHHLTTIVAEAENDRREWHTDNIVWLKRNIHTSLFSINDFPYQYISNDDFEEIKFDSEYVITSLRRETTYDDAINAVLK